MLGIFSHVNLPSIHKHTLEIIMGLVPDHHYKKLTNNLRLNYAHALLNFTKNALCHHSENF